MVHESNSLLAPVASATHRSRHLIMMSMLVCLIATIGCSIGKLQSPTTVTIQFDRAAVEVADRRANVRVSMIEENTQAVAMNVQCDDTDENVLVQSSVESDEICGMRFQLVEIGRDEYGEPQNANFRMTWDDE